MDDSTNREYSRVPQVQDVLKICKSLNDQDVKYVLIGGFAVILHGFVRGTKDIDLLVDVSEENIQKVKNALSVLPDNAISLIKNNEISQYQVVRIADEVIVDLMAKACGIDYEQAKAGIQWMTIESVRIPVASKEWLIRMKDTIRPHDKTDINFLRQMIEKENQGTKDTSPVKASPWYLKWFQK